MDNFINTLHYFLKVTRKFSGDILSLVITTEDSVTKSEVVCKSGVVLSSGNRELTSFLAHVFRSRTLCVVVQINFSSSSRNFSEISIL